MKFKLALALLIATEVVLAAPYYRFWRGQKLPQLSENTYTTTMARDFLPLAPKLFPHLTSYLVAATAIGIGVDEVALLAYTNEEDYIRGRATAEGTSYGNAHWEIFERQNSASLVPEDLLGKIAANKSYDLLRSNPNWGKGFTTFFIGNKHNKLSTQEYLEGLDSHVRHVRQSFVPMGLKGYVILVSENREYAFMNWESETHAVRAFSSSIGRHLNDEATQLMATLQWSPLIKFQNSMQRNRAYFVERKQ